MDFCVFPQVHELSAAAEMIWPLMLSQPLCALQNDWPWSEESKDGTDKTEVLVWWQGHRLLISRRYISLLKHVTNWSKRYLIMISRTSNERQCTSNSVPQTVYLKPTPDLRRPVSVSLLHLWAVFLGHATCSSQCLHFSPCKTQAMMFPL